MSAVKQAMLLLLVAISANARPGPEDCGGLNVLLPKTDLHKIYGHWVVVWTADKDELHPEVWENVTSSHLELKHHPDNTTEFIERNMYRDKSCINYYMNMTTSDSDEHTLHHNGGRMEKNGVVTPDNDTGTFDFFETCPDCLMLLFNSTFGQHLMSYRREGHHHDVQKLKAAHSDNEKLAGCLGFPLDQRFIYDGVSDLCH